MTKSSKSLVSLIDRFRDIVDAHGDRMALTDGSRNLTYAQLWSESSAVGSRIANLGVGPGDRVGVSFGRSIDFVVTILGVLKTGGSYVPLDPDYPQDRLDYLITDSDIQVVIASDEVAKAWPESTESSFALLSWSQLQESAPSSTWGAASRSRGHAAYHMYTSGSTGLPKGVCVTDLGILRLAIRQDYVSVELSDVFLLQSSIAFDASTFEIWGALLNGAQLVVAPATTPSVSSIREVVLTHGVTVMWLTAALFHIVVDQDTEALRGVRVLLAGGDALSVTQVKQYLSCAKAWDGVLVNGYGPTEATTFSCCQVLDEWDDSWSSVPIGYPLRFGSAYVLDQALNRVPVGSPGELYVGGAGLAHGYWGRPGLTATQFIPNPYGKDGSRLYKTGDRVRYLEDGRVEFIGRVDQQVKIRGHRIEPGEIEAVLSAHPTVKVCLVDVLEVSGSKRLVAYVVGRDDTQTDAELRRELLDTLKARLPAYMVPTGLLVIEEMPLTINGKVDRARLPAFDASELAQEYVVPVTDTERKLQALWASVLKLPVEKLGVTSNFYELGGDSILAIQLVSRTRKAGLNCTVKQLTDSLTVRALAEVIDAAQTDESVKPADQGDVEGEQGLLPIHSEFFANDVDRHHFNQSMLVAVPSGFRVSYLRALVRALVQRHDALRLRYRESSEGSWSGVYEELNEAFLDRCVAHYASSELDAVAQDIQESFSLEAGGLFRVALFSDAEGDSACSSSDRLLFVFHHLLIDGVSWRIVFSDAEQILDQFNAGTASVSGEGLVLPPKTHSYQSWADYLSEYAQSESMQGEQAYWQAQLSGGGSIQTEVTGQSGFEILTLEWDEDTTRRLLSAAPKAYRTQVNELLLTAVLRGVQAWSGQRDVLLKLEGHGRESRSSGLVLDETVGWFTSAYPLRLSCSDESDALSDWLCDVKEDYRSIPNKGLGYGVLRYLKGVPELALSSRESGCSLLFNYLGQFDSSVGEDTYFKRLDTYRGEEGSRRRGITHPISLNGQVNDGRLVFWLSYERSCFSDESMQTLKGCLEAGLSEVVEHCCEMDTAVFTPSDFALSRDAITPRELSVWQSERVIEDIYPATPMQQGLIYHTSLDSSAYVTQSMFTVSGVSADVIQASWQTIVDKYAICRTSFVLSESGDYQQLVEREVELPFEVIDVRSLSQAERERLWSRSQYEDKQRGFDVDQGPLMRVTLWQVGETEYRQLWSHHHALLDGWCMPLVLSEWIACCERLAQGEVYVGREVVPYRNYIAWLHEQDRSAAEAYWVKALSSVHTSTVFPEASVPEGEGVGEVELFLDSGLTSSLQGLAQSSHCTLNILIQAAWGFVLSRCTGQSQVSFGTTISGRPATLEGVEQMVGLMINTVPNVMDMGDGADDFSRWLKSLNQAQNHRTEYGYLPLKDIQKLAGLEKGASLFDTLVVYENYPVDAYEVMDEVTRPALSGFESHESNTFGLTLFAMDAGERLRLSFQYQRSRYEGSVLQRTLGYLEHVLDQFTSADKLSDIELFPPQEVARITQDFNAQQASYDESVCMHELFEAAVERQPDAIALHYRDETMSYGELNARANRLAHYLRAQGAGPEVLIGLCVDRSLDMMVGLYAILKSGAGYVPMDPQFPTKRLAYLLSDSGVLLLLTQSPHASKLSDCAPSDTPIVSLDDEEPIWSAYPDTNIPKQSIGILPTHRAYVIYTSGSTGEPKGVEVEHHSVMNRLDWMPKAFGFGADDVVLQKTPIVFDVSIWELFTPLALGGRLVIAEPDGHKDPQYLCDLIRRHSVNLVHFVPSMLQVMLQEPAWSSCTSVRHVFCSGEALPMSTQEKFISCHDAELHNLYGPTEASIEVTSWTCDASSAYPFVPMGRPIQNVNLYVLDQKQRVQPIGMPGELYIGGYAVVRGYLNRSELTEERFIDVSLSDLGESERMYRTGDLVRWLPDGNLEYLGRMDNQIKIRGFRVELGEIETALCMGAHVSEAVVLLHSFSESNQQLVAYVLLDKGTEASAWDEGRLRQQLSEKLPSYMVPAVIMAVEAWPTTVNGKLDRAALPAPDVTRLGGEYVAPKGRIEESLVGIWSDVLGLEASTLSTTANFYELGGDSILAIQVVSRARAHGLSCSVKNLTSSLTIRALARHIERADRQADDRHASSQQAVTGVQALLPLQHDFFAHPVDVHYYNQSMLFEAPSGFSQKYLVPLVEALVRRHDALRLRYYQSESGAWVGEYQSLDEGFVEERIGSYVLDDDDFSSLTPIAQNLQESFSLEQGELFKVAYFSQTSSNAGRLLLVFHHLLIDGVSWRILVSDAERALRQLMSDEPVELGYKTSSYQAWVEYLLDWSRSESLHKERDYWASQLSNDAGPLPTEETGDDGYAVEMLSWNDVLTQRLLSEAPKTYRTQVNELLLASVLLGFKRWSDQDHLRVDLEGHGREDGLSDLVLDETVGWFTSFYPFLLSDPDGSDDLSNLICRVKEDYRSIPNKGLGYGVLRHLSGDDRLQELEGSSGQGVLFNYLGQFDSSVGEDAFFKAAPESRGVEGSSRRGMTHELALNGQVSNGQLSFSLTYARASFTPAAMRELAGSIETALTDVVEHCCEMDTAVFTPSDFALSRDAITSRELSVWQSERVIEDIYPATPMQQGLIYHTSLDSSAYVTQSMFTVSGVSADVIQASWQTIVDKYAICRTSFVLSESGDYQQLVEREVELPFEVIDVRSLSQVERERLWSRSQYEDKQRGFDVDRGPLMRVTLWQVDETEYRQLWSHHHALLDGWCMPLVLSEWIACCERLAQGEVYVGREVVPYRNYIAWLHEQDRSAAEAYWVKALSSVHTSTVFPEASVPEGEGVGEVELFLDSGLTSSLQGLAQSSHCTLNILIQAAWGFVLSRCTGQSQVSFGTTISGRPATLEGVEQMVGLMINTVPNVMDMGDGADDFSRWLKSLNQAQNHRTEYGYLPLKDIQKLAGLEKGASLFDTLVVYENYPVDAYEVMDEVTRPALSGFESHESNTFGLTLFAMDAGERLRLSFQYQRSRYEGSVLQRTLGYLEHVLDQFTSADKLSDIELFPPQEVARITQDFNAQQASYDESVCMHELFEAAVERQPDAIALHYRDETMSYGELNARANRLAHYLRAQGAGPEVLIGLCVDRSLDMMVGLYAILKSGAGYVPMDPQFPTKRLAYLLSDSGVLLLLTQSPHASKLSDCAPSDTPIVSLDDEEPIWSAYPDTNIPKQSIGILPTHRAYVIYTSGSTGEPKGVEVEHHSVMNRLDWMPKAFGFGADDVVLQKTPIVFDVSIWELFTPLALGGRLVIAEPDGHKDPQYLCDLIRRHSVNLVHFVPSMLQVMLQEPAWSSCTSVRHVFCSGEALPMSTQEKFISCHDAELHNLYGPTEASIEVTSWTCDASSAYPFVPMGRPIQNVNLYVLDQKQRVQPIGMPGELYIGGYAVVRGYLNRSELTEERFIDVSLSDLGESERMYRTGDLVRWLPDGNLEYLGRMDNQIKIRGFRVELGEIETALCMGAHVSEAVVLLHSFSESNQQLVAYVLLDKGTEASAWDEGRLRQQLSEKLPSYMVPAVIMAVEAWPTTVNGKLDHAALPAPDVTRLGGEYVAPKGRIEESLVGIWSDVLGLEASTLSTTANFYELGGDSILAIQVVSRARAHGLSCSVKNLTSSLTIRALARHIERADRQADDRHASSQQAVTGVQALLPLQHDFFAHPVDVHYYNQSMLFEAPSGFSQKYLVPLVEALVRRHDALRLRYYQSESGAWVGEYQSLDEGFVEERIGSYVLDDDDFSSLTPIAQNLQESFSLEQGELFKVAYFSQTSSNAGRLLLVFHHLLIDGVSWRILVSDAERALRQLMSDEPVELGYKTSSYQAWVEYLLDWSRSESLHKERDYWASQLSNDAGPLPTEETGDDGYAVEMLSWNDVLTQRLLSEAPKTYRTQVNELLLASVLLGFKRWSDQDHLRVDLEGHGREDGLSDLVLDETVGWFTSFYPFLLSDPDGSDDLSNLICRVKEDYRSIPNKGLGYGVLRHLSGDDRLQELEGSSGQGVLFNYLGQFDSSVGEDAFFKAAPESRGVEGSSRRGMTHELALNGQVSNGQLSFSLTYARASFTPAAMRELAGSIETALTDVVEHCCEMDTAVFTPSDFALSRDAITSRELSVWQSERVIEDIYPATPMQQGLIYHTSLDSSAYVTQSMFTVSGVSADVIQASWQTIVDKYAICRTSFVLSESGDYQQLVEREVELPFEVIDVRSLSQVERERLWSRSQYEDKQRGFDVDQGPLMRVTLWQVDETEYRQLWSHHHALLDGWCMPLVLSEWIACCERPAQGEVYVGREVVPYRNYIAWLHEQDRSAAEAYWQEQLKDITETTNLPQVYRLQEDSTDENEAVISKEVLLKLKNLAKSARCTLGTVLTSAWGLLLSHYTRKSKVVFGTTVSGRPATLENVEHIVGLMINTIPVVIDVPTGGTTVVEWLKRNHRAQEERIEHAYLPLTDLVSKAGDIGAGNLFDSLLIVENYPSSQGESAGQETPVMALSDAEGHETTNYGVTLTCKERSGELRVNLQGKLSGYEQDVLEDVLANIVTILNSLSVNDSGSIQDVTLIAPDQEAYLLNDLHGENHAQFDQLCLHELFESYAYVEPDEIAVSCGDENITYSELNRRSNGLAYHLREQGVGPEVLVGMYIGRSIDMVVSILAILKSGAAYVPLDTVYPDARLSYMIADSSVGYVLTTRDISESFPSQTDCSFIYVDECRERFLSDKNIKREDIGLSAENAAYVVYTSGSTGQPKGVVVEHRNGVSFVKAAQKKYDVSRSGERVLQLSNVGFDIWLEEFALSLLCGNTLVIPKGGNEAILGEFWDFMDRSEISIASFPTALWNSLGMDDELRRVPSLKICIVGGDVFSAATWEAWDRVYSDQVKLFNAYGPTEATSAATGRDCTRYSRDLKQVPIGIAFDNTKTYVLNESFQLLPKGAVGELCLGGTGVARGYLNNEALTAERFIPDQFSSDGSMRLYRTGDLVRWSDEGELLFLGRIDEQVKINGYRVELNEIKFALLKDPEVKDVALVVRSDVGSDKILVAYVIPENLRKVLVEPLAFISSVKRSAAKFLPSYMVPKVVVPMERFPITENGKLDKHSLPLPVMTDFEKSAYRPPKSETEKALTAVWKDILEIEEIGLDDSFFSLGGNSLMSVRLVNKVNKNLELNLSVKDVLEYQTISELACHVDYLLVEDDEAVIDGNIELDEMEW